MDRKVQLNLKAQEEKLQKAKVQAKGEGVSNDENLHFPNELFPEPDLEMVNRSLEDFSAGRYQTIDEILDELRQAEERA